MTKQILLLIEDEEDLLRVTKARLEASEYKVLCAQTGEEALKILRNNKPDLILLDLLLPTIQGEALCKKWKSDPKYKNIPIIIFTAKSIHIPEDIKEMGANDYILKPFESKELLQKIKNLIDTKIV